MVDPTDWPVRLFSIAISTLRSAVWLIVREVSSGNFDTEQRFEFVMLFQWMLTADWTF
jgi:hypothetical protein